MVAYLYSSRLGATISFIGTHFWPRTVDPSDFFILFFHSKQLFVVGHKNKMSKNPQTE